MIKVKRTFKLMAYILCAGILFTQIIIPASAESIFDEVYTNYYYKHSFVNGQTAQYCLSSDDSLEGYVEVGIGGNSADNPGLIGNAYMNLTSLTMEEISQQVNIANSVNSANSGITEMTTYDKRVVLVKAYYGDVNKNGIKDDPDYLFGTGFIIQDFNGKSCIATAGHNVYGGKYPEDIEIDIMKSKNQKLCTYHAEAVHIEKNRVEGVKADCSNDYALITVNCGISLAQKYGYLYLATIDPGSSVDVRVIGNIIDTQYIGYGNLIMGDDIGLHCNIKVEGGMSGSPIIIRSGDNDFVVAIDAASAIYTIARNESGELEIAVNAERTANNNNIEGSFGPRMKWSVTRFLAFNPFA